MVTNLPSGFLGAWDLTSSNFGTSGYPMDQTISGVALGGQKSVNNVFSSVATATNKDCGIAQFISSPLTAQTIGAGASNWQFYACGQVSNAAANFVWAFRHAFYLVNGSTGAIRTTIVGSGTTIQALGSTGRSSTSALTAVATTVSTNSFTATAGDYLVWEWGINVNNTSGSGIAPNITVYAEGTTGIGTDNAAIPAQPGGPSTGIVAAVSISTTPLTSRFQTPVLTNVLQQRSPGFVRTQIPVSSALLQQRAPGFVRAQLPMLTGAATQQPRSGDVDIILMRGFDSSLNKIVYWMAGSVDPTGAQYTAGNPNNLSDIVAIHIANQTGS